MGETSPKDPAEDSKPPAGFDSCPRPDRTVTLVVLSADEEDHRVLRAALSRSKWHIHIAGTWEDARPHLKPGRTAVVIFDHDTSGGGWEAVLASLAEFEDPPMLIVASRRADDFLWAEVLNLGGYDVLAKPLDSVEVFRVVNFAWMNWKELRYRRRRLQAAAPRFAAAS